MAVFLELPPISANLFPKYWKKPPSVSYLSNFSDHLLIFSSSFLVFKLFPNPDHVTFVSFNQSNTDIVCKDKMPGALQEATRFMIECWYVISWHETTL